MHSSTPRLDLHLGKRRRLRSMRLNMKEKDLSWRSGTGHSSRGTLLSLVPPSWGYSTEGTICRSQKGNLQIPLELVHAIVCQVEAPATLLTLCLVSHTFRDVATEALYHKVHLTKHTSAVKGLKVLRDRPELARHVRELTILSPSTTASLLPTKAFAALLSSALHNTTRLSSFTLHAYGPWGSYLRSSPFRAITLNLACDWDADLAAWLQEQSEVRVLVLTGIPSSDITLAPSALPNLHRLIGLPSVIRAIVPGRPVEEVFVTCVVSESLAPPSMDAFSRACKLSTGPVRTVHVCSKIDDHPTPEILFDGLSALPLHLPDLVKLSSQVYTYEVDEHFCLFLCELLGRFRRLESLFLYSEQ
ncbi:hypothetical protein C8Q74DRAFT_721233 [Fomes fomentarius]|nr:hypothetical protein C8Q74DRAFT_721233 [Fomes fomentarius]